MKKINFEELMASVGEQFVEEAASFSPIKAFNTRFVALVACIAIIVTAVPAVVILNREKDVDAPKVTTPVVLENDSENTKKPPNIEPFNIIYCDADMIAKKEELINNALLNKDVEIKEFVEYNSLIINQYQELGYSSDIPEVLTLELGNKVYNCTLECVYNTKAILSTNEMLKNYAKTAKYSIDGMKSGRNNSYVYYRVETKEIVAVSIAGGIYTQLSLMQGSLTEEEVASLAKKDLTSLYGKSFVTEYDFEIFKDSYDVFNNGNYCQIYRIVCKKSIGEFETSEKITIQYNTEGELLQIGTQNLGVFDTVNNVLNEKTLLKAEANALKIYDGKLVDKKYLKMGNDGKPYMYTCLRYVEGQKMKYYSLYYSIDIE